MWITLLAATSRGGYTQSDEMTLVLASASVVRGEQQCHSHGGRVVKICASAPVVGPMVGPPKGPVEVQLVDKKSRRVA